MRHHQGKKRFEPADRAYLPRIIDVRTQIIRDVGEIHNNGEKQVTLELPHAYVWKHGKRKLFYFCERMRVQDAQ